MSNNLSFFLAGNALKEDVTKFVVSDRFVNGKCEPIEWELAPVTSKKANEIKKDCTKRRPSPINKNIVVPETDFDSYLCKLVIECVKYPDLNNAELQDSYHVVGAENLIQTMLKDGEYQNLLQKVQEINGFDVGLKEKVEEAKN
jgi:hypothetical protein